MTRVVAFLFSLGLVFLVIPQISKGQENIFDFKNSLIYAEHLSSKQDYKYAALEYQRLLILKPEDDSIRYHLIRSYRLAKQWDLGIGFIEDEYPEIKAVPNLVSQEYLKILFHKEDFQRIDGFLNLNTSLPVDYKSNMLVGRLLLAKDWTKAYSLSQNLQIYDPVLLSFAEQGKSIKRKSPVLASLLSVIIPGLGKVYSGDWKNGLVSFVYVGTAAFGAYRGFKVAGINSGFAWVFTGIGSAFYLSSIYGSHREAKGHNQRQEEILKNEVASYLYSNF